MKKLNTPKQMDLLIKDSDYFQATHVFDAPRTDDIVRLEHKVRNYLLTHEWLSVEKAQTKIESWKIHTASQFINPLHRSKNANKVVLSLFDLSGVWSQPWVEAGYQVYRFDIQSDPETGDINKFCVEFFNEIFSCFDGNDIYAILAACPCTDFAVSGARHFASKDADGRTKLSIELVHQTLRTIEFFKPAIWSIENPVGRIEKLTGLEPWRLAFNPNHFGDTYTKKTLLWGRFNADLPIAPVEPIEGSKMHKKYGGKSLATKNARSVTPLGFAYSFFLANNAIDNPVMALSYKYDRIEKKLIEALIESNISEEYLSNMIDDHYYDYDDDTVVDVINEILTKSSKAA